MLRRAALLSLALIYPLAEAKAGGGWVGGPFKLQAYSQSLSLKGQIRGLTWVGSHGRVYQPLPSPRPLDDIGTLTPPPGAWDAVIVSASNLVLVDGTHRLALPASSLELVLDEPVQGGAPVALQLDLELSPDALSGFAVADALSEADPRLAPLLRGLQDGGRLILAR